MSRSLSLRKHVPGLLQRMQQQPNNAVRDTMRSLMMDKRTA